MARGSNPLERTSVQLMLGVALIALCANSAVDRTDDGLPWEVTLGGFCVFAVIFSAVYAKRTEVALGICSILFVLMPTYFVHNYEVPFNNWLLGSVSPMSASKGEVLSAVWSASPNTSRYDEMLGLSVVGLSLMHFSMFNPGIALIINTSEVYHSGLKLDDPLTKRRSHDYLLFTSPRKVKGRTESLALLARVPTKFDVWPKDIEDYEFSLQTAANIVAPPIFTGELVKLDKGKAIDMMIQKHNLRPFLLDVYNVEYKYD